MARRKKKTTTPEQNAKDAAQQAEKGNYQDAAEDKQKAKGQRYERWERKFDSRKFKPIDIINKTGKPLSNGSNDDAWHVPSAQLVDSTSKINFKVADGHPIMRDNYIDPANSLDRITYNKSGVHVPGICAFDVFNTIGETNDWTDPFNEAGAIMFAYLQKSTGRVPQYDQAALQMYIYAVTNAYGLYQFLCRVYGTLNDRNFQSRYQPQALVHAQHCDYSDLRSHLQEFRTVINQFALDLGILALPSNISYTDWYLHQFETVYKDSDTMKAQLYLFNPAGFYVWTEGQSTDPISYLSFRPLGQGKSSSDYELDLSDIKTLINDIMSPLLYSQDLAIIKADVLNTFGDALFKITQIAETYIVTPVYNQEISSVIENSYVYGIEPVSIQSSIKPDTTLNGGACIATYEYQLYGWEYMDRATVTNNNYINPLQTRELLFNWHEDETPTPERALTLTRYSGIGVSGMVRKANEPVPYFTGFYGGCYNIIASMTLYYLIYAANSNYDLGRYRCATLNPILVTDVPAADIGAIWSKFDWAPSIRQVHYATAGSGSGATASIYLHDYLCDVDNFATIPMEQLQNMNEVAMKGEFTPRNLGGYSPIG